MKPIDLTAKKFQGSYGKDIVEVLKITGFYKLRFRNYINEKDNKREVEVVHIANGRMQVIVVKKGNEYQDFYYNGAEQNFKFLTEPGNTFNRGWEVEDVRAKLPDFLVGVKAGISGNLKLGF